ncbi:hypothetical protein TRIUR3_25633 [Triticum urartu]|uniref:Uncharacterized protein n=1 Tax=Triticum urartu TaxID=4572 RepID=M8AP11_TRIUA|nr:hypothetical protein TRIUR3_25633 [Triticum urartu]
MACPANGSPPLFVWFTSRSKANPGSRTAASAWRHFVEHVSGVSAREAGARSQSLRDYFESPNPLFIERVMARHVFNHIWEGVMAYEGNCPEVNVEINGQHYNKEICPRLLGWMHRKLRSNNDVFKEFNTAGGGACNCIAGLASPDDEYYGDDAFVANNPSPPVNADDLFTFGGSGLLTIGTLGFAAVNIPGEHEGDGDYDVDDEDCVDIDLDSIDGTIGEVDNGDVEDGAATPTFTFPQLEATATEKVMVTVEAIAEKDDVATTEDDLMLVSAELEKFLGGSNVPSARVSFAMGIDCPLQGFLLGSPVCSDTESWPEKPNGGGRRASLGELFMRTRFTEEKGALVAVQESEDGGEREEGQILKIFHRKVYPESTMLTKKNRKRGTPANGGGGGATNESVPSPTPKKTGPRRLSFGCCCTKRSFSASLVDDGGEELNGDKSGHWIKTDADCD